MNDEFGNIATVLPQAIGLLANGGRLAVISFHSGEDRIVKQYFKEMAGADYPLIKILTKNLLLLVIKKLKIILGVEVQIESN